MLMIMLVANILAGCFVMAMLWRALRDHCIDFAGAKFTRAGHPGPYWSLLGLYALVLVLEAALLAELFFNFDVRSYL